MSYVDYCKEHGDYKGDYCGECIEAKDQRIAELEALSKQWESIAKSNMKASDGYECELRHAQVTIREQVERVAQLEAEKQTIIDGYIYVSLKWCSEAAQLREALKTIRDSIKWGEDTAIKREITFFQTIASEALNTRQAIEPDCGHDSGSTSLVRCDKCGWVCEPVDQDVQMVEECCCNQLNAFCTHPKGSKGCKYAAKKGSKDRQDKPQKISEESFKAIGDQLDKLGYESGTTVQANTIYDGKSIKLTPEAEARALKRCQKLCDEQSVQARHLQVCKECGADNINAEYLCFDCFHKTRPITSQAVQESYYTCVKHGVREDTCPQCTAQGDDE